MAAEITGALLGEMLGRTLEEAAFLFAEASDAPPPMDGTVIEARLAYLGPEDGELLLAAPAGVAATLAANLLGEEEGGAAATGDDEDAVGELLNMIAGALVEEVFGTEQHCQLGLPRVRRVPAEEYQRALAQADAAATLVEEEGRRLDLSIRVGGGAGR